MGPIAWRIAPFGVPEPLTIPATPVTPAVPRRLHSTEYIPPMGTMNPLLYVTPPASEAVQAAFALMSPYALLPEVSAVEVRYAIPAIEPVIGYHPATVAPPGFVPALYRPKYCSM